jgi:drug/metabolite transporter (DMT)-like permease
LNAAAQHSGTQSALASAAVAYCGLIWGVYWLPLRHLADTGFTGSWASAAFFVASVPPAIILAYIARRELIANGWPLLWLSIAGGIVMTLYSNAYTRTTVFNVLFLFYLSPVWSVLIARFLLREHVSRARLIAVALGLIGLVTMLSDGGGLPIPRNLGDWMALIAGLFWAIVTVFIRRNPHIGAVANTVAFYFGGFWPALFFALATDPDRIPTLDAIAASWPMLIAVAWIGWLPSQLALYWGVSRISPVRTGILLMTELVSGVTSAAWLSGDPISLQQAIGGALILAAGLGDVLTTRERAMPAPMPVTVAQD